MIGGQLGEASDGLVGEGQGNSRGVAQMMASESRVILELGFIGCHHVIEGLAPSKEVGDLELEVELEIGELLTAPSDIVVGGAAELMDLGDEDQALGPGIFGQLDCLTWRNFREELVELDLIGGLDIGEGIGLRPLGHQLIAGSQELICVRLQLGGARLQHLALHDQLSVEGAFRSHIVFDFTNRQNVEQIEAGPAGAPGSWVIGVVLGLVESELVLSRDRRRRWELLFGLIGLGLT